MLIVDSQIHIWGSNLPANPAHRQITSYTAEDVLRDMDEAGVDAAVIHPPGWDPGSDEMAVEAARRFPNRFSILGKFGNTIEANGKIIGGLARSDIALCFRGVEKTANLIGQRPGFAASGSGGMIWRGLGKRRGTRQRHR